MMQAGPPKYHGIYEGVVVDNEDPEGRDRVRISVFDGTSKTAWARPFGTAGGGGPQRGGWVVPDVGADVFVQYINGDLDRPVYCCDGWSIPPDGSEMPIAKRDVPPKEARQISAFQFGKLSIYIDEREGKRKLVVEDTELGDNITWDLEVGVLRMKMTAGILLEADGLLRAEALQATVNGRIVEVSPKPI